MYFPSAKRVGNSSSSKLEKRVVMLSPTWYLVEVLSIKKESPSPLVVVVVPVVPILDCKSVWMLPAWIKSKLDTPAPVPYTIATSALPLATKGAG